MIPANLKAQIAAAYEIFVTPIALLPDEIWSALQANPRRVNVMLANLFDADYVLEMLRAHLRVLEVKPVRENIIVIDRELAYTLVDWVPIPQPFSLGCKLSWSRLGYYTYIDDTVTKVTGPNLFRVKIHHDLWFSIGESPTLPSVGEPITILANRSFLDNETPLLSAIKIWSQKENASDASNCE